MRASLLRGAGLGALLLGLTACVHVRGDMLATGTPGTPLQELEFSSCISGATRGLGRGVILRGEGQGYDVGFCQDAGRVPGTLSPDPRQEIVLHNRDTGEDMAFSAADCQVLDGSLFTAPRAKYTAVEGLSGMLRLQCERDGASVWGSVRFDGCAL
jgi:hypothetical protein